MDRIQADKVVIKPAEVEKIYPDLYITSVKLGWCRDGSQPIKVGFRPYNFDTKEVDPDVANEESFVVSNIWREAVRYTEVENAIKGLVTVLSMLRKKKKLEDRLQEINEPINEPAKLDPVTGEVIQDPIETPAEKDGEKQQIEDELKTISTTLGEK